MSTRLGAFESSALGAYIESPLHARGSRRPGQLLGYFHLDSQCTYFRWDAIAPNVDSNVYGRIFLLDSGGNVLDSMVPGFRICPVAAGEIERASYCFSALQPGAYKVRLRVPHASFVARDGWALEYDVVIPSGGVERRDFRVWCAQQAGGADQWSASYAVEISGSVNAGSVFSIDCECETLNATFVLLRANTCGWEFIEHVPGECGWSSMLDPNAGIDRELRLTYVQILEMGPDGVLSPAEYWQLNVRLGASQFPTIGYTDVTFRRRKTSPCDGPEGVYTYVPGLTPVGLGNCSPAAWTVEVS